VGREAQSSCGVGVGSDGTENGVSKHRRTTAVNHQTTGGLEGREVSNGRCYAIRREGRVWGRLWLEHCLCLLCSAPARCWSWRGAGGGAVPSLLLLVRCCFSLAAASEIAGVLLCARSRDNTAGGQAGRQAGQAVRLASRSLQLFPSSISCDPRESKGPTRASSRCQLSVRPASALPVSFLCLLCLLSILCLLCPLYPLYPLCLLCLEMRCAAQRGLDDVVLGSGCYGALMF